MAAAHLLYAPLILIFVIPIICRSEFSRHLRALELPEKAWLFPSPRRLEQICSQKSTLALGLTGRNVPPLT
jgi:hypothetical protein